MEIACTLEKAWKELNQAPWAEKCSESTVAFAFTEAIRKWSPELRVVYDNRDLPNRRDRPNLAIWQNEKQPRIHFLGRLIVDPPTKLSPQRELEQLLVAIKNGRANVLGLKEDIGHYIETAMEFDEDFRFGILLLDRTGVTEKEYSLLVDCIPEEQRLRFIYAQECT